MFAFSAASNWINSNWLMSTATFKLQTAVIWKRLFWINCLVILLTGEVFYGPILVSGRNINNTIV
jgi:hypothetical protein